MQLPELGRYIHVHVHVHYNATKWAFKKVACINQEGAGFSLKHGEKVLSASTLIY